MLTYKEKKSDYHEELIEWRQKRCKQFLGSARRNGRDIRQESRLQRWDETKVGGEEIQRTNDDNKQQREIDARYGLGLLEGLTGLNYNNKMKKQFFEKMVCNGQ